MAVMSADQVKAELQRKKNMGIAPTSSANQTQYNVIQPMSASQAASQSKANAGVAMPANAASSVQATPNRTATGPVKAMKLPSGGYAPISTGSPMNGQGAGFTGASGGSQFPFANDISQIRNGSDLYDTARSEYQAGRSSLANAASTQIASLQNSANYENQLLQDNRVLEDGNFARTNAPAAWDGSVGYRGAQLDRGRQIDDTMRAADLSNAINSVQQSLYDYDANENNAVNARYNDLIGAERAYKGQEDASAINKGQLTGTFMDPTAQGIANQIIGLKQKAEAQGITAEQRSALSGQATQLRNQLTSMGYDANQFGADINSSAAQGNVSGLGVETLGARAQNNADANQQLNETQVMASLTGTLPNGQKTTAEQQRLLQNEWNQSELTGVISNTLSQLYGIPQGTPTQSAKQFAQQLALNQFQAEDSSARGWAGQYLNEDQFKYDQMKDAATAGTTKTVSAATAGDMLSQALQKVVGQDENGNDKYGVFSDPTRREEAFVNMINTTGLRGNDVVTALTKAGYKINEINALQKEYPEVFQ